MSGRVRGHRGHTPLLHGTAHTDEAPRSAALKHIHPLKLAEHVLHSGHVFETHSGTGLGLPVEGTERRRCACVARRAWPRARRSPSGRAHGSTPARRRLPGRPAPPHGPGPATGAGPARSRTRERAAGTVHTAAASSRRTAPTRPHTVLIRPSGPPSTTVFSTVGVRFRFHTLNVDTPFSCSIQRESRHLKDHRRQPVSRIRAGQDTHTYDRRAPFFSDGTPVRRRG